MKLTELKEARYYGATAPSAQDVHKEYEKAAAHFNEQWDEMEAGQSPYSLTGPISMTTELHKKYYPGDQNDTHYAGLDMHFHWDIPKDKGMGWSRKFMKDNNLLFTQLDADDVDTQDDTAWAVTAYYDFQGFADKYRS